MKIYIEPSINKLAELMRGDPFGCDEFWDIVFTQHLENALENYINEMYSDGVKVTFLKNTFRYEGGEILKSLGADLTNTIYEE